MKKKGCLLGIVMSLLVGASCFTMVGCGNNENKDDVKVEEHEKEDKEDLNNQDENIGNVDKNENEKTEKEELEEKKSKEAKVYYVDDTTGEVLGKTIMIETEYDIWRALQETGILAEDCQLLSFKVDKETRMIDLDFNAATGNRIRSMGTTGEVEIIGCIINTYLESYDCEGIKLTEEGKVLQTSHGANYDGYSGIMLF